MVQRHDHHVHEMHQGTHGRAHAGHGPAGHEGQVRGGHQRHHAHMVADFRRRFWISLIITIPVLTLSPMIQRFLGLGNSIRFSGDLYALFGLSSFIFFYGGYPFLKGLFDELKSAHPGMMTLIAIAITTAYTYSLSLIHI